MTAPASHGVDPTADALHRPACTRSVDVRIRAFDWGDLDAVSDLYAHEVLHGTATYDSIVPGLDESRASWQARIDSGHPVLVAIFDGMVAGYAYAGRYRPREGYRFTVENSVYVAASARGQGIGLHLLDALVEACTARGARQMVAVIGDADNIASIRLHVRAGFTEIARFAAIGRKFGRWLDQVYLQRPLGDGASTPPDSSP